ncbi:hypothetical protein BG28_01725 [Nesterenkonia sp. AN1]|uniref:hypothetical protein n=1 Tax=Nesterenkonia sp. AN1 TaxID=652017 RepID=UPI0004516E2D|nr:hypothetical protein [Nesterenkonia sp. AN1]EXF26314.1 hypothetical protein BG28_01725 [Nesterenkonia sp. AN1]
MEQFTADPASLERATGGRFWTGWQSAVAIMGIPLIAWMYFAPLGAPADTGLVPGVLVAIFLVATIAGRVRRRF